MATHLKMTIIILKIVAQTAVLVIFMSLCTWNKKSAITNLQKAVDSYLGNVC